MPKIIGAVFAATLSGSILSAGGTSIAEPAQPAQPAQPYAGQQHRAIKALSADSVAGYLAGKGMGMAKPAELNGWPGPIHVLELAGKLRLSPTVGAKIKAIYNGMKGEAVVLGRLIVAAERKLDGEFAGRAGKTPSIVSLIDTIASLKGRLRAVHLKAHLAVRPLLTAHQVARYKTLRGYGGGHNLPGTKHH